MPSQMLEEWMTDPTVLKKVSCHYTTKEPLSDDLIASMEKVRHFGAAEEMLRMLSLSMLCLSFFMPGTQKDLAGLAEKSFKDFRVAYGFPPYNKQYAAFSHLIDYGAKYYGYAWSKVYALDLFDYCKKHGLFDPHVGERYIQEVIGRGGSRDPLQSLTLFLGRKPRADAFLKDFYVCSSSVEK